MAGPGVHHYQLPWPAATAPPPVTVEAPSADEVRTIFISGLPVDVKERELQNLLRWLPGYEACQINFKEDQPMGFALFSTAQHAMAAKAAVQDLVFDGETKSVLHTEMAKKNLYVKRGVVADSTSFDQSKRLRTEGIYTHTVYQNPSPYPPPAPVWGAAGYMTPAAPYVPYGGYPVPQVPQVALPVPAPLPAPSGYFPVQDVSSATAVHQNLQGAILPSSGRGGMRIQFSKNPFGRRKDSVNGAALEVNGASTTYQQ